jgi:ribosome biogenesis GTPase
VTEAGCVRQPRTSLVARGSAGRGSATQPLAANVDTVLVCAGLHAPLPVRRLERLLTLAWDSGAGKSTVVNALAGASVMATSEVREVDGKGRHTTTHRELIELPSGAVIIDTPGLRAVALQGGTDGLAQAFSDIDEAACRFTDCAHDTEPGCAVRGTVDEDRLASWRHLQRELAFQARRGDARLEAVQRQKWKAVHKQQRQRGGRP